MNIEELRKRFPSLDQLSARKLLGGWISLDDNPGTDGKPDISNSSDGPSSVTASVSLPQAPGNVYFGEDGGDMGDDQGGGDLWGESGPSDDSGGDSNPGGSEGGSGQSSSGNNTQSEEGAPPWWNRESAGPRPYDIKNFSSQWVAIKYGSFGNPIHWVGPGQTFSVPEGVEEIDGININGDTFKLPDGFNWIEVYDTKWNTNYTNPVLLDLFYWYGGGNDPLDAPPNDDWFMLFYANP